MKKKIIYTQITYHCIHCEQRYQTTSNSKQDKDVRIMSCSGCNPFYTGASASEIKVGAVEKYRQRAQKVKPRA